jgi:ion channel-forming bestrophin family protein
MRHLWINVGVPEPKPGNVTTSADLGENRKVREEKICALRLIAAYVVAVKHHLRAEPGIDYPDFDGLLPGYFLRFSHETTNIHEHSGAWESPVDTTGATTPHPTRIMDVGTSKTNDADQRTPLMKDQHHIVHFHSCALHLQYHSCTQDLTISTVYGPPMLSPCH